MRGSLSRSASLLVATSALWGAGCGYTLIPNTDRAAFADALLLTNEGGRVQCTQPAPPMDVQAVDAVDAAMDVQPEAEAGPEAGGDASEGGTVACGSPNAPERVPTCPRTPFQTTIRVAHFITELTTSRVDFCLQRVGDASNTWIGPLMKLDNNRDSSGMLQGMAMGQVSRYFPISPGNYRVRVVNGQGDDNSISCDSPISGTPPMIDITLPPEMTMVGGMRRIGVRESVEEHRYHTLVMAGRNSTVGPGTPPTATLLSDRHEGCNTALSATCTLMLRAFHAAPGLGETSVRTTSFPALALTNPTLYRFTGVGPLTLDCNEYSEVIVYTTGMSPRLAITSGGTLIDTDVRLTSGVMSVYLVGRMDAMPGSPNVLRGIMCDDLANTGTSFSRCRAVLPGSLPSGGDPCAANPLPTSCGGR